MLCPLVGGAALFGPVVASVPVVVLCFPVAVTITFVFDVRYFTILVVLTIFSGTVTGLSLMVVYRLMMVVRGPVTVTVLTGPGTASVTVLATVTVCSVVSADAGDELIASPVANPTPDTSTNASAPGTTYATPALRIAPPSHSFTVFRIYTNRKKLAGRYFQ